MSIRMRHTRGHTGNRRSHHALKAHSLTKCECGAMRVSHRACPVCGRYNGRVAVDLAAKAQAKLAKQAKLAQLKPAQLPGCCHQAKPAKRLNQASQPSERLGWLGRLNQATSCQASQAKEAKPG